MHMQMCFDPWWKYANTDTNNLKGITLKAWHHDGMTENFFKMGHLRCTCKCVLIPGGSMQILTLTLAPARDGSSLEVPRTS